MTPATHTLRPRPAAARRRAPTLIHVELAPAQRDAVKLPPGRHLLVLGEAGHGKTTVALHRMAHLWRQAPAGTRACVVVPTEGLERWLQPLLRRLGADVEVVAYERWARAQARSVFRDLPERESEDSGAAVARLKRHPALLQALREVAARGTRHGARRSDLLHLFGDRALLEPLAASSGGAVPARTVEDVLEHTHVQFSRTAEQEWSHVTDRARLVAVDRLALDVGTASGDARSVDTEDYAVLFEIDRLRAGLRGTAPSKPPQYDLMAIDEAQELATIELMLLGRSLAPGGTLVVAGDAAQQLDPSVTFESWEATMRDLGFGRGDHATVTLEVGYRCPRDVVEVARRVLDGGAPVGRVRARRSVFERRFADEADLAAWIARELSVVVRRDRSATHAIVCRGPLLARRMAERMRRRVPLRLVLDGSFLVRGGVQVTTVDQVKGLEFDTVVVPDATAEAYPDEPGARRALYVAVTRARHQLVLASAGKRTPLLGRE